MMLSDSLTIDLWSKMPEGAISASGDHSLLSDHRSEEMQHLVLRDSKLGFVYRNMFYTGNALMPGDKKWHRLTVVVDNQKYTVYVDGLKSGSSIDYFTRALPRSSDRKTVVRCVGNLCDGTQPWGYFSLIRILNDNALTSSDILQLHQGTLDKLLPSVAVGCSHDLFSNMNAPMWVFGSRGTAVDTVGQDQHHLGY